MPRTSAILRVAILCEFGTVNGGERSLMAALDCLRPVVEPILIAPSTGRLAAELRNAGLRLVPFDVRDGNQNRRPHEIVEAELVQLLATLNPDVLHGNSLSTGRITGRLASRIDVPCTAHLRDIIRLNRATVDDLNRNARLFVVSAATQAFHGQQGVAAAQMDVLYNGVDTVQFRPSELKLERAALRTELRLPEGSLLALTIGQIGVRKGWDVLAAAAAEIAAHCPEVHFVLAGERYSRKNESIEFEAALTKSFEAGGLSGRVHHLGYREDVAALMRGVDLLIHPARQEPFGRVLLEAAASGLPIIATRVGGTEEMLVDGDSACLIAADDSSSLARSATELLRDASLRTRLGAAARQRVMTEFPIARTARNLRQAWQRVAAGRS